MNLCAIYRIHDKPLKLKKVIDGLWVTEPIEYEEPTEADYFRSADLFQKPMIKPSPCPCPHCGK